MKSLACVTCPSVSIRTATFQEEKVASGQLEIKQFSNQTFWGEFSWGERKQRRKHFHLHKVWNQNLKASLLGLKKNLKQKAFLLLSLIMRTREELCCEQKLSLSGGNSALKSMFTVSHSSVILIKFLILKRRLPNNAMLYLKYCWMLLNVTYLDGKLLETTVISPSIYFCWEYYLYSKNCLP